MKAKDAVTYPCIESHEPNLHSASLFKKYIYSNIISSTPRS